MCLCSTSLSCFIPTALSVCVALSLYREHQSLLEPEWPSNNWLHKKADDETKTINSKAQKKRKTAALVSLHYLKA